MSYDQLEFEYHEFHKREYISLIEDLEYQISRLENDDEDHKEEISDLKEWIAEYSKHI